MAKWVLIDDGDETYFKNPRELGEYLRFYDEGKLIEYEIEFTIIVVED